MYLGWSLFIAGRLGSPWSSQVVQPWHRLTFEGFDWADFVLGVVICPNVLQTLPISGFYKLVSWLSFPLLKRVNCSMKIAVVSDNYLMALVKWCFPEIKQVPPF